MSPYRRWSLRLSSFTLATARQLALADGWQLSDFVRTILVMGAAANWLALESEERAEGLRMRTELAELSERVSSVQPRSKLARPYASRSAQDTEVIGLMLPNQIANLIESYANLRGQSKNDLCGIMLTEGLTLYMTGERNLLEATVPANGLREGNSVPGT